TDRSSGPVTAKIDTTKVGAQTLSAVAYGGRNVDGSVNEDVIYRARFNEIRVRTGPNQADWKAEQKIGTDKITQIALDPTNWKVAYAVGGNRVWATVDGGDHWADITGPSIGPGALAEQRLNTVLLIPLDQPDLRVTLRDGKASFDVTLRGARTINDLK